jgi:hypothetical protein
MILGQLPAVVTTKPRGVAARIFPGWETQEHDYIKLRWPKAVSPATAGEER